MTEPLDRNDIISLLNGLGSDRDEDVLEAARQVHARITAAGMAWEDLLVPDQADEDAGEAEEADDDDGEAEEADEDAGEAEDADEDAGEAEEADEDAGEAEEADDDAGEAEEADDDAGEAQEADDDAGEAQEADEDAGETEDADRAEDPDPKGRHAESLAQIDKLLARSGISDDLREELKGYKTDIAEGEFQDADRRYLRALSARLTKRRRAKK